MANGGNSVEKDIAELANPLRGFSTRPAVDSLLTLKMLGEVVGSLAGTNDELARNLQEMTRAELVYFNAAAGLLRDNQLLRDKMGGYTLDNVNKLVPVIRNWENELLVKDFKAATVSRMGTMAYYSNSTNTGGWETDDPELFANVFDTGIGFRSTDTGQIERNKNFLPRVLPA